MNRKLWLVIVGVVLTGTNHKSFKRAIKALKSFYTDDSLASIVLLWSLAKTTKTLEYLLLLFKMSFTLDRGIRGILDTQEFI